MSLLTINGLDKLIGHMFRPDGGQSVLVVTGVKEVVEDDEEAYIIELQTRVPTLPFHIIIYRKQFGIQGWPEVRVDILGTEHSVPVGEWFKDMNTFCEKVNDKLWTKY